MTPRIASSYTVFPISLLSPGPQQVSFQGIVTNVSYYGIKASYQGAAKGYLKLLVRDETGDILVKLWYAEESYKIVLGQNLKVSTMRISPTAGTGILHDTIQTLPACIMTSIFPEMDPGCCIKFMSSQNDLHTKTSNVMYQTGVTSLKQILHRRDVHISDAKILVMVLEIGKLNTLRTKSSTLVQMMNLKVMDHSSIRDYPITEIIPTRLLLNTHLFESALTFTPNKTVLLISNPQLIPSSSNTIKLSKRSQIIIDPDINEAIQLREWTHRIFPPSPTPEPKNQTQGCQCRQRFHDIMTNQARGTLPRKQYTLSLFLVEIELYQQREATRPKYRRHIAANSSFVGYISVILTQLSLLHLYQASKLFTTTCPLCYLEVYANTPTLQHRCSNTEAQPNQTSSSPTPPPTPPTDLHLAWNPALLSGISDETGGFSLASPHHDRHNIHLTDDAVLGLSGLTRMDLQPSPTSSSSSMLERLRRIEEHARYERMTLVVGWTGSCTCDSRCGSRQRIVILDVRG